ncbi:hypothetical protein FGO68_gene7745 [Halteria grandinella]|uniref:Uncharacterized protein n=1 Tax=Halteria grandinella TaxID=5974 RepID=A0A8J8NA97_HALGN|nr:hypothetical protein FGO68_gene7745 [Halteria grandinella]
MSNSSSKSITRQITGEAKFIKYCFPIKYPFNASRFNPSLPNSIRPGSFCTKLIIGKELSHWLCGNLSGLPLESSNHTDNQNGFSFVYTRYEPPGPEMQVNSTSIALAIRGFLRISSVMRKGAPCSLTDFSRFLFRSWSSLLCSSMLARRKWQINFVLELLLCSLCELEMTPINVNEIASITARADPRYGIPCENGDRIAQSTNVLVFTTRPPSNQEHEPERNGCGVKQPCSINLLSGIAIDRAMHWPAFWNVPVCGTTNFVIRNFVSESRLTGKSWLAYDGHHHGRHL